MNEDVFPIKDGDFPASYVCLPEGIFFHMNVPRKLVTPSDTFFVHDDTDVVQEPVPFKRNLDVPLEVMITG